MKHLLRTTSAIICLVSLALTTQPAAAEPKAVQKQKQRFNNLDQDNNGRVTQKEFLDFWKRQFQNTDKNKDGVHDQTEIHSSRHFEHFDHNKDGVITLEESLRVRKRHWSRFDVSAGEGISLASYLEKARSRTRRNPFDHQTTFTKMDADGNNYLTEEEYLAFWNGYFDSRDANQDGALTGKEHGHAGSFKDFDADGDGTITRAEDVRVREEDFQDLDTDGDGSLTQAEFVR